MKKKLEDMVRIKANIYQIMDGIEYGGGISFDEYNFEYKIRFDISLKHIGKIFLEKGPKVVEKKIHIEVKDPEGKEIKLNKDSNIVFRANLIHLATEFYINPMTRLTQIGTMGRLLRGDEIEGLPNGALRLGIGMQAGYELPVIPPLISFLEEYDKSRRKK
ncbi:hypothetical protein ACFLZZ_00030 [Nanoarchaeota archaeon]